MTIQYSRKELVMTLVRHLLPPEYIPFGEDQLLETRLLRTSHSNRSEDPIGQDDKDTLRVSSWNVRHSTNINGILDTIQKNTDLANSDVIALQEVKMGEKDYAQEIARATGFGYVYGIEFLMQSEQLREEIGNMLLSRHSFVEYTILRLSAGNYSGLNNSRMIGSNMAIRARIIKNERQIIVYSAHLELMTTMVYRRAQIEKLLEDASRYKETPVLIAGAFNFVFESQRNQTLKLVRQSGFQDPLGDNGQPTVNDTIGKSLRRVLGGRAVLDRVMSRGLTLAYTKVHYDVS